MRQIEEFSKGYSGLVRNCITWICALAVWVWICTLLHFRGMDVSLLYSMIAFAIGFQLFRAVTELLQEERRAQEYYRTYLDTLTWSELSGMNRNPHLSNWSKQEIARYLSMAMRLQF